MTKKSFKKILIESISTLLGVSLLFALYGIDKNYLYENQKLIVISIGVSFAVITGFKIINIKKSGETNVR